MQLETKAYRVTQEHKVKMVFQESVEFKVLLEPLAAPEMQVHKEILVQQESKVFQVSRVTPDIQDFRVYRVQRGKQEPQAYLDSQEELVTLAIQDR